MQSSKRDEKQRQIYHLQAGVYNEAIIITYPSTEKDETQVIKAKRLISNHSAFFFFFKFFKNEKITSQPRWRSVWTMTLT